MQLRTNTGAFNPFITNVKLLNLEIDYSSRIPKVRISGLPHSVINAVMREWGLRQYDKDWLWDYCAALKDMDYKPIQIKE